MNLLEIAPPERARTLIPELCMTELKVFRILKTVLLAEDDDDLRYVMECSLRGIGYLVVACADAHLAAKAFHSHPEIDLLMTDIEMPGRSGLELARELTALSPSLPVMMITGSLLSAAAMEEIRARQWTYISKPCDLSRLETTMKQILTAEVAMPA